MCTNINQIICIDFQKYLLCYLLFKDLITTSKKNMKTHKVLKLSWEEKLEKAESIGDIFEIVKEAVWRTIRQGRAGLSLILAEIPNPVGGIHQIGSNMIIVNKSILEKIKREKPDYYKPYLFYVLLHEYLHSLGYVDEDLVRKQCYIIAKDTFGKQSKVLEIAKEPERFLAVDLHEIESELDFELVRDFDRSSLNYIF